MNIDQLRSDAEAGSTVAQSILGISLLHGSDVEPDYAEAFRWLSTASENGAARATLNLGLMFEQGLGVSADQQRPTELYNAAAQAGELLACVYLARLFAKSPRATDREATLRWYREAAAQRARVVDCPESQEAIASVAAHKENAEQGATPDAPKKARR